MDGRTGEEECGVNEEKSRGEFHNEVLASLIRMIYTALMLMFSNYRVLGRNIRGIF